jgi:hypothetical protein
MQVTSVAFGHRGVAFILLAILSVVTSMASAQTSWRPLFNGIDLDGWKQVGSGKFVVDNGVLRTEGGMGLLWYTREKFGDTTIRVVFGVPKGNGKGNSGVFIRIPREPTDPWLPVNEGFEVQIDEHGDDFHRTGVLYSFTQAKTKPQLREWNTLEIVLEGSRTVVRVNGVIVTDFREGDPVPPKLAPYEPERGPRQRSGYIGLQNHGPEDIVLFREISVKDR